MMRVQNGNYQAVCLPLAVRLSVLFWCLLSVCCGNVTLLGALLGFLGFFFCFLFSFLPSPACCVCRAQIGKAMAELLAAHFSSGFVAAKLGGAERPVCGSAGTGALWRDLGFVAQRYVVKVLGHLGPPFLFFFSSHNK